MDLLAGKLMYGCYCLCVNKKKKINFIDFAKKK